MNKFFVFFFAVLIFCSVSVNAQKKSGWSMNQQTEISLMGGYMFSGSYQGYHGEVDILDAPTYGAAISFRPKKQSTMTIELEYLGSPGKLVLTPFNLGLDTVEHTDVSVNYFLIGVGYGTMASRKTQLFSMLKIGMVYASPSSSSRYESVTNFAASFSAGGKLYVSKSVGIRLQAGLYFPVRFNGGGVYIGGGGADYGVSSASTIMQFNLGGGLIFMF